MKPQPAFGLEERARQPDSFYLGLTVAGYVTLAVVLYCFGRGIVPFGYCVTAEMLHRPYAQDPQTLLCLVPGAILGYVGTIQLRMDRTCTSAFNRKLLGLSFRCNAFAVIGFCGLIALSGSDLDLLRLSLGAASLGLFAAGVISMLLNIALNLGRCASRSDA